MRSLNIVGGRGKGQCQSFVQEFRRSTDVIKMTVGEDHIGNLFCIDMMLGQRALEGKASVIKAINCLKLRGEFMTGTHIHQDLAIFEEDQQNTHGHVDAIFFIRGVGLAPKCLRHHAKHGSPVKGEPAGFQGVNLVRADVDQGQDVIRDA